MWLQKLRVLHKNPLPGGKQAEVASMALAPYCAFTHGPCLLLSTSDSFLTVYRIQDSVSQPRAESLHVMTLQMWLVSVSQWLHDLGEDY